MKQFLLLVAVIAVVFGALLVSLWVLDLIKLAELQNDLRKILIGWREFLPRLPLSAGQVDLNYFRGNLSKTKNIQGPPIRRPAGRRLIRLRGRDGNRFAARDGEKIDLVVRANAGNLVPFGGNYKCRIHSFWTNRPRLAVLGRFHIETKSVPCLVTRENQPLAVRKPPRREVVD